MIAGRYTLEREVGRGGSGAVWLGRDELLGRVVALKRIGMAPGGGVPDVARAEREARLAARLNHPHVVAVYDLVTEGDVQWLVMEYVEGSTLAGLVGQRGALSPEQAAPILRQAADALAAAHAAGIVHRDVKPSNILVAPDGQVKLSDFGIARAEADASLTQTGLVTGSPAYLSPEVASGQQATPASDVWSLGATLYHALAGRAPYEVGDNVLGALYRIVHEEPPRLPEAGRLASLLAATMCTDPQDRWSMAEVRDFLAGSASAPPPRPPAEQRPATVGAVGPEATRLISGTAPAVPPPPVAPPVAPPAATPVATPVATPAATERRRRTSLLAVALVVVAVLVVGVVAWVVGSLGDDPAPSARPRSGGTSTTGSPGSGSSSPTAATTDGMENFVETYLATVTSDPQAAWQMLTPAFQDQSGGFGRYQGFWATIATADLISAQADPATGEITYTVEYVRADGSKTRDEVTLVLEGTDGAFQIAGET